MVMPRSKVRTVCSHPAGMYKASKGKVTAYKPFRRFGSSLRNLCRCPATLKKCWRFSSWGGWSTQPFTALGENEYTWLPPSRLRQQGREGVCKAHPPMCVSKRVPVGQTFAVEGWPSIVYMSSILVTDSGSATSSCTDRSMAKCTSG